MKKTLLLSVLLLALSAPARADVSFGEGQFPVPIERRVPWTIISGTDSENSENLDLGGLTIKTGKIADLIDRNPLSFWHTKPDVCNGTNADHSHWFLIDRGIGASKVPFDMLSIQQRVIQEANPNQQSFNGAVKDADIYVTDDFIGLQGGNVNMSADDATIYDYRFTHPDPTLHIELSAYTQEAQLFQFDQPQTGRFILVVITHTINPNGTGNEELGQGTADQYACLSEFNLFNTAKTVTESNFSDIYAIAGDNPTRTTDNKTVSLAFSFEDASGNTTDVNTDAFRYSPVLQANVNPYIPDLNWLDWDKTYFDITNLINVSTGNGMNFQIQPTAVGSGLYQSLYIDWDNNGFDDSDKVYATESTVSLNSPVNVAINIEADNAQKSYRARYMVDNQNTSATPSAQIANGGIVVDFMLTIEKPVTFNVNLKFEDRTVGTKNGLNGFANIPFTLQTPDFFDVDIVAVAPEESGQDIDVILRRFVGLPFAISESVDNAVWQVVQQSYNFLEGQPGATEAKHNLTWTYDSENDAFVLETEPADISTEGFSANQYWAFVGDAFNGFKIYNKVAGTDKCLSTNGETVTFSDNETLWNANYAGNRDYYKFCAFKNSDKFINYTDTNNSTLGVSTTAGDSSACRFIAPAAPLLETVADFSTDYSEDEYQPVGAYYVAHGFDLNTGEELIANATANPYDLEAVDALRGFVNDYTLNVTQVKLEPNHWYRLLNYWWPNNGNNPTNYVYSSTTNNHLYGLNMTADQVKTNYHTLFKFEPVPDTENKYYIETQGKYLGSYTSTFDQTDDINNAGQFVLGTPTSATAPAAVFGIGNSTNVTDNQFLHQNLNGGNGTGAQIIKYAAATSVGSWFYLYPAAHVDVELQHQHLNENVGFAYFDFPVTTTDDGTKLYYVYQGYDKTDSTQPVISYREVTAVPARTAFMIRNEERNRVTLAIDYDSQMKVKRQAGEETADDSNILDGSMRPMTAGEDDYVIGTLNGAPAFIKTGAKNVDGNFVYIPATNLSDLHKAQGILPLNDPEQTTDIAEITAANHSSRAIYDLHGRKLNAPVKGINIINGKKLIIK